MSRASEGDARIADVLERSRRRLIEGSLEPTLLQVLRERLPRSTDNLFLVNATIEQGEDLYDILVDGNLVAQVEVSRVGSRTVQRFEVCTLDEYLQRRRRLPKQDRRVLKVAVRLAMRVGSTTD